MPLIQSLCMLLLAVGAGAVVPLQGGVNAMLGRGLGHPLWATLVSLLVSIVVLLPVMLLLRVPLPTFEFAGKTPFWLWSGGVYGVFFISLALILMPKLGASGFVGAAIFGQILASLVLDYFGLLGMATRQISAGRVAGAILLISGVLLMQFSGQAASQVTTQTR